MALCPLISDHRKKLIFIGPNYAKTGRVFYLVEDTTHKSSKKLLGDALGLVSDIEELADYDTLYLPLSMFCEHYSRLNLVGKSFQRVFKRANTWKH